MKNSSILALALLIGIGAKAQSPDPEHMEALHARPSKEIAPPIRSGTVHEYFLYDYLPNQVPVVDDFSVDRTRHLNASSTDANVTLTQTIYRLEVNGVSSADMSFVTDTTYHTTVEILPDDTIKTIVPQASVIALYYDLSAYPPPDTIEVEVWPPYALIDTVGDTDQDTVYLDPDLIQDSMLVYTAAAITATYTNPDNSTRPLILWETDHAYVNGTYPIDPPTIGVASFDGMDRTGYPYEPENPNSEGLADVMTSVPIEWNGATVADSVYLSFFYQPQGRSGDVDVDETDSLYLELYSPSQHEWFAEWSTPYTAYAPFKQVMVPITYPGFLQDGFRMRFSNRATLGGAVDHWHIDYVRLGPNRSVTDTLLQDVAWTYPANTLLAPWTSVPLAKYNENPALYMANSVELTQRNLYNVDALITTEGVITTDCAGAGTLEGPANIINNANTVFTSTIDVNSGSTPYLYDLSGCPGAAFATTRFRTEANPDALRYNDTATVVQEISNYYSYDDGSAEQGYWINTQGGRIAYRFDTQGQDSLRAVRMYFDPIFTYGDIPNDPRDGDFLITVWQDLDQLPIFQNISFSSPEYRPWGPDHFVEYPLDSTIVVGGTFYVGWTQTNAVKMNLGLDKNRVNNDRMFYNVGDVWQQSQAPGSWMMRPVMVSTVDPFASVPEPESISTMELFPNPATDEVRIRFTGGAPRTIELMDATGRRVSTERYRTDGVISVNGLSEGLYVVRALDTDGRTLAQQRLIVQR